MAKMKKSGWCLVFLVVAMTFFTAGSATAALQAASPTLFVTPAAQNTGYPVWYQDFNGLKLELCNSGPFCLLAPPLDPVLGVGDETFWWTSDALMATPSGIALLVQAMEAAFGGAGTAAPGQQISFGRVRIRVDLPVTGTYTVTYPFGVKTYVVDAILPGPEINDSSDIGCLAAPCNFAGALSSGIGPFLYWNTGLPVVDAGGTAGDNLYIGDGLTEHAVFGSPSGTNFFRVDGPPGSNLDGLGHDFIQTSNFAVSGKVFTAAGTANTAPTAVADAAVVRANQAAVALKQSVTIPVLANDIFIDIPINPTTIVAASPTASGGVITTATAGDKVMLVYTPADGFAGTDTFTYTVSNFGGVVSAPATVTVTVETLNVEKAELRPRFMKWRIEGSSSDVTANTISVWDSQKRQSATLSGAQQTTPVVTNATGSAELVVNDAGTEISFTLSVANILNVTSAHVHAGARGADGPVIFTLSPTDFASPLGGLLTAASFSPSPAVPTFNDAINAILTGTAYVQIHTAGNPAGELRGQLGPNRKLGEAVVGTDGTWSLDRSVVGPSSTGKIRAVSSNGVEAKDIPLRRR